jgi:geranylgeranyl reductase family protein
VDATAAVAVRAETTEPAPSVRRYDAIVVGAGPAGSVTAFRLASAGASVLLLDKARFPRDKPCGGGLTIRAVKELPIDVTPVVEHVVDRMRLRLRYGSWYERRSEEPLILMTQRRRLDAFLVEQAAAAGAEVLDGTKVTSVAETAGGVEVAFDGARATGEVLIGADGANGVCARQLSLAGEPVYGVALEGNLPYDAIVEQRYRAKAVIELAILPGGYGWVFPKGDHANFGVGGWERTGPTLRDELRRLCDEHGVPEGRLESIRGHRLPLRRPDARLARGRSLVVGDAAGLVDPLSGDGMYEAFVSSRLAADAAFAVLRGEKPTVDGYDPALRGALGRLAGASWNAKLAFDRFPRVAFALSRPPFVWPVVESILRGELQAPGAARGLARLPIRAVLSAAEAFGAPGRRYEEPGAPAVR